MAFSYISVSTGTFTLIARPGRAGPCILLGVAVVIVGQLFVALNFAELCQPLPGRRLDLPVVEAAVERTLGWFTGWIYFWAGV